MLGGEHSHLFSLIGPELDLKPESLGGATMAIPNAVFPNVVFKAR